MFTWSCLILTDSESLPFEWTWEKLLLQTSLVHHGGVFVSYSCVRGGFVCDYRVSVEKLPEERAQIKAEAFRSDSQAMGGRGSAGWYRNQQKTQRYSPHISTSRTHMTVILRSKWQELDCIFYFCMHCAVYACF